MEGKTVKYRISRDEWKLFFARLAPKARYLWYLFALTAVFYALYTLLSMALAGTTAAGAVYLLFVVYILLFIYIARGALPRGRLELPADPKAITEKRHRTPPRIPPPVLYSADILK